MTRYPTEADKLKKAIEIAQLVQRQMAKEEASKKAPPQKKVKQRREPHLMRDAVDDMQKKHSVTVGNVTINEEKIEMAKHLYNQVHEKKFPVKQSNIEKMIGVDPNRAINEDAINTVKAAAEGISVEDYANKGKQWYDRD